MDRVAQILEYITKDQLGIEIGPWFNPIVPKREGYHSLVLDIFDANKLRTLAQENPGIHNDMIPNIEEVDLIGPVTNLTSLAEERHLVGQVDYIVSSHNFEHIPDPVRFLQACEKILKRGGVLSMAIPDRRTCFDYFRPHSTTGELLDAFWQRRDRPTPGQLFSHHALHAYNYIDGADRTGWSLTCDPSSIRVVGNLEVAMSHARLQLGGRADLDIDVHCWAFTPASFELIISELQTLGLLDMRLKKVVGPNGHEFYAHFVNEALEVPSVSSLELARKRTELLHRVNDEAGTNSVSSNTRDRTLRELQAALSTRA